MCMSMCSAQEITAGGKQINSTCLSNTMKGVYRFMIYHPVQAERADLFSFLLARVLVWLPTLYDINFPPTIIDFSTPQLHSGLVIFHTAVDHRLGIGYSVRHPQVRCSGTQTVGRECMVSNVDKVMCGILHCAVVESYTILLVSTIMLHVHVQCTCM